MTDSNSSAVKSKNSTFFAIQFFCVLWSTVFLKFDVCLDLNNCWETDACRSCRSSLFNLLILISIVTIMMSDSVCIWFEIRSKFESCCSEICSVDENSVIVSFVRFWKISNTIDQTIEISSELEKLFLTCLRNVNDNCIDLLSVNEKIKDWEWKFDFWKVCWYSLIFRRNCLIVRRKMILSITHFDKKNALRSLSFDVILICLSLDFTIADLKLVFLIKIKVSLRFFENFVKNSSWYADNWKAIVQRSVVRVVSVKKNKCLLKNKIDRWEFEKRLRERNIESINRFAWKRSINEKIARKISRKKIKN